jgi:hypothetical protein
MFMSNAIAEKPTAKVQRKNVVGQISALREQMDDLNDYIDLLEARTRNKGKRTFTTQEVREQLGLTEDKKNTAKNSQDFKVVRPEEAIAFDPVEFQFAFAYATEVSHSPATILNNPKDVKIHLKTEGKTKHFTFTDIPMNRLGFAMVQRFKNNSLKFSSFMWRWFAFIELIQSNMLGEEFRKKASSKGEPDMIHSSVIELAGSFPLTTSGKFNHSAFLKELRKKISQDEAT